jgi:small subunit ribosomal protein S7e
MAYLNKIEVASKSRTNPSELDTQIATALYDLENNTPDMKSALRPLQIVGAKEVRTATGRDGKTQQADAHRP